MDRASAEKEAIRLWRNLPLQDRLDISQVSAFARMIAPTLEFDTPESRTKTIEAWLLKDLARTETIVPLSVETNTSERLRLAVPGWPQREGASAIAFVIALLVLIARRPDIVSNAMLWTEDGAVWFADAYNHGWWAPLFRPHSGYLQIFPRLVFDVATLLPLQIVPLFGVWVALLVRAALPAFLFSSRFNWIDWRAKVAITAYYLLMPNLAEVHANVTNTHWYLGLYLIGVIFADAPRTPLWKAHDWAVLLVAGATGPMAIFALPCLALRYFAQRTTPTARLPFFAVAIALALVQLATLWLEIADNLGRGLFDADLLTLIGVLGSRIFLGFLTPTRWASALAMPVIAIPTVIVGVAISIAVLIRGEWRARSLLAVVALLVAAALYTPAFMLHRTQWLPLPATDEPGYFVVTSLLWAGVLVLFAARFLPRLSNAGLAVVAGFGGFLILFDFALPAVLGSPFGPEVNRIEAAAVGETVTVPIAPPGWEMVLVKR
ncbi:MAG: hypothetical protein ABI398_15725 [Devosia sp.]